MADLSPSHFFDLSQYTHKQIFLSETGEMLPHVWKALAQISSYLESLQLGKIEGLVSEGATLVDPESISIGKGSVVEPGAYIKGPCWIGEDCQVRQGAYIRGNVITGSRCVIGHTSELKNAILLDKAQAAHFAYVGDSILGNETNLGAGVKCANFKLSGKNIAITMDGKRIPTGRRKLGLILGDGSQLGCNSVTNPGTLIGKGGMVYPCISLGGYLPEGTVLKNSDQLVVRQ